MNQLFTSKEERGPAWASPGAIRGKPGVIVLMLLRGGRPLRSRPCETPRYGGGPLSKPPKVGVH